MKNPATKYTRRGNLFQVAFWAIKDELEMRKQRTFAYCPRCNFELCSMNNATVELSGLVYHVCKNCRAGTRWNYDAPSPINVT